MQDHPLATWGTSVPVRFAYPVCPENEIHATPIGMVDTSGGFAGLVLPLSKCLVTGIPSLIVLGNVGEIQKISYVTPRSIYGETSNE